MNLKRNTAILLMSLLCITSCTHSHKFLLPNANRFESPSNSVSETEGPWMQIITTRSALFYSHAALRLRYQEHIIFWDPAGTYGMEHEWPEYFAQNPVPKSFRRSEDVILAGEPGLRSYWKYSLHTGDVAMEVFEWPLSQTQAQYYYELLLEGTKPHKQKVRFMTTEHFKICSSAVSSFLIRFAHDTVPLEEHYSFPHDLSHALHKANPQRIIYFEQGQPLTIYTHEVN